MKNCPCGSTLSFDECCKPYISGKKNAPTAEATMRARYSAYVTHDIDYIEKTNKPNHGEAFDREAAKLWAEKSEWLGLEVVAASGSEVEFIAKFKTDGKELRHHEVSQFEKIDGQWFYMDGKILKSPDVRSAPKIGRNDPCSCGSGKKFKKCCAA